MIGFFSDLLFGRGQPLLSEARVNDAAAISALHTASFRRGWSEQELESLLSERNVLAHRATSGANLSGFIISRHTDEAEILSVAVANRKRGKGLGTKLLALHLGRLAALNVRTVFLEVDENNQPAKKLYERAGFREVGHRPNYYRDVNGTAAGALVLRRDL
jgi:ribosomal-protein-alanine N-acetyltransferase